MDFKAFILENGETEAQRDDALALGWAESLALQMFS